VRLAAAGAEAGALSTLDLGADAAAAAAALAALRAATTLPFGVRVGADTTLGPESVLGDDGRVAFVVLADAGAGSPAWTPSSLARDGLRVFVEVTDVEEAERALDDGAHDLVARGGDSGGRVSDLSSFVLLQRLRRALPDARVWIAGGIGLHTARACAVGGAAGVVLDTQLALLDEADTAPELRRVLTGADGSESELVEGVRVLRRRARAGAADEPRVPLGQDAFLADVFAKRYRTVRAAVRALRSTTSAVSAGLPLLEPGAPLAVANGTALPLAQGPMTRVSDTSAFAEAVAAAGGLPFLALALSSAAQSAALLDDTAAALADRPWGVGVLGFADRELLDAQLVEVRRVRPSHVIIAGGRPAQAAELEADGISVLLHVPSPALLRQFIAAGARRFVFEGTECGGHVGPRNSFALWEGQLAVLEELAPTVREPIDVYFAGGIADAHSSAMVAALAAPLAAMGVRAGLLVGTAYLFTREAVSSGAISPAFQEAVVAASATDLLETAPGHATRCVTSPFTREFLAEKSRLAAEGIADRDAWEHLETLNVGRLRVASKGLDRAGDRLVEVGPDEQWERGMFMAGQVVALREHVTDIAGLHDELFEGGRAVLAAAVEEPRGAEPAPAPLDVAIVGMSCFFPGATHGETGPDLASFWATVLHGDDAVTEVDPERWDPSIHYRENSPNGDASASRWGGFLPRIPFDPLSYGIPPASLRAIEPAQLLALEASRRALDDAGIGPDADRSRISVIFGAEAGSDLSNASVLRTVLPAYVDEIPADLDAQLPRLTEDSFPGLLANVISGRVANRLDLGGANYTVDAACASSLTAIDAACKELVLGSSDAVVCGGVDLHNGVNDYLLFSSVHALSPTGRSRTFDATADGIALGEGVGCVILKRLADAERDGDRVYAVIRGVGAASDGRSLGLTAPRPEGQRAALERAYRNARVSPAEVELVEAHGTGTVVGDRTELTTLTTVFHEAGAPAGAVALGSVKSQIGHTKCAAGLAGLIKTALAIHTGVIPPTINLTSPNPAWDRETSPFRFHTAPSPWTTPLEERVAGVSAFGFGGTNFHVVLTGHRRTAPARHAYDAWPAELVLLRGDDAAARGRATQLRAVIAAGDAAGRPWRLRDLAAHAAGAAPGFPAGGTAGYAIVARSVDELDALLARAEAGEHEPLRGLFRAAAGPATDDDARGGLAFLYPGQGSQRPDMLADLFVAFPELRTALTSSDPSADAALASVLFPPTAFDEATETAQLAAVTDTRIAQPALGVAALALTELLTRAGVTPDAAAGHSYGELAALAAAGVIAVDDLLDLSRARANAVVGAIGDDPGSMAAVRSGREEIEAALAAADGHSPAHGVVLANLNAPDQTVISGPTVAVEQAVQALAAAGISARPIPVACAFHSPVIGSASEAFAADLTNVRFGAAAFPVWANRTAEPYPVDAEAIADELAAQLTSPVRFVEQIESMYAAGIRTFVELGPGRVLSSLVGRVLGERPHREIAAAPATRGTLRDLLLALAELAVSGEDLRIDWLFRGRDVQRIDVAAIPARAGWTVDGATVRVASGGIVPGALVPARRIHGLAPAPVSVDAGPTARASEGAPVAASPSPLPGGHDVLVADFLRTTRELVQAQRDVVLGYLGATPAAAAAPLASAVVASAVMTPAAETRAVETPARDGHQAAEPAPVASLVAPPAEAARPTLTFEAVLAVVVDIIADRTGYPADMIEPDLDLEADLSIDSIKRTEIAGELATRLSGGSGAPLGDTLLAELSRARTTSAIAAWLLQAFAASATSAAEPDAASAPPEPPAAGGPVGIAERVVLDAAAVLLTVVETIADRTGYPADMIEPDLDLEADLSIDSIKRTEIAGELAARLGGSPAGAPALDDTKLAQLSKARTARSICDWLVEALSAVEAVEARGAIEAPEAPAPVGTAASSPTSTDVVGDAPERLVFVRTPLPAPVTDARTLAGRSYLVVGSGATAQATRSALLTAGASAHVVEPERAERALADETPDGLLYVDPLDTDDHETVPGLFSLVRAAVLAGVSAIIAARPAEPADTRHGAHGLRGFFRSLAREYPDALVRDVQLDLPTDACATAIVDELLAPGTAPVVVVDAAGRSLPEPRPVDLGVLGATGAGPAGDGAAEATAIGLDRDAVVVLVGGARGITAQFARTVAAASRARIELLGRTVLEPEPADLADARDRAALRSALVAAGGRSPAQIERSVASILAQREVRGTLDALHDLGSEVGYRTVDVTDADAVRAAIADIHAAHGRIDGIVYAAGVIEDRLVADKDPASFHRVYSTKVDGARAMLSALDELPERPAFTVFFGSIAGALGNRGQIDYAAANDALDSIGAAWSKASSARALTVHWGPWAPDTSNPGMVSPELGREYARRGIKLIAPSAGTTALLKELAWGDPSLTSVIYTASGW